MVPLTRCKSKVFASFPWLTDAVVSNVDLVAYFGEAHPSLVRFFRPFDAILILFRSS